MQSACNRVAAVLEAADNWVTELEALVAARQLSDDVEAEQEAVDIAGSRLVTAVKNWRSGRRASVANGMWRWLKPLFP
jgi:hypothetical protein